MDAPPIVDWKSAHPLLRYAGFDNVQVVQSLTAQDAHLGGRRWWRRRKRRSCSPGELGRQRIIWIGFDTLESNWPLRVSFPIFIANAVDWLNPANARSGQLLVKAGDPFRLALTEPVTSAQVTLPDGTTKTLTARPERQRTRLRRHPQAGHLSAAPGHERHGLLRQPAGCRREQHQAARRSATRQIHQGDRHHQAAREHGTVAHHRHARAGGAAVRVVVLPSEDGVSIYDLRYTTYEPQSWYHPAVSGPNLAPEDSGNWPKDEFGRREIARLDMDCPR